MTTLQELKRNVKVQANKEKAVFLQSFFKTGNGQYGEGDMFLGLTVPQSRIIAKQFKDLPLEDTVLLLKSPNHEERLIALFILVLQFTSGDTKKKQIIYDLYLFHTKYINNWDLVDSSADKIIGQYLLDEGKWKQVLPKLAHSSLLWDRRISMIATFQFLKNKIPEPTISIAEILVSDKHDLIQKAVGWMLREMGKKCGKELLVEFLAKHYKTMPRTALRYAIEHFPPEKRKAYLSGTI